MKGKQQEVQAKKSERTREHIVKTALELFKEKGFELTTMRDVAQRAGLSVGSTYYYFRTKEALVLAFYVDSCRLFAERTQGILKEKKDFKQSLLLVISERLNQLAPFRSFLGALMSIGLDPTSDCSPFSATTEDIREDAIQLFRDVIQSSNLKVPASLQGSLPRLLWLYHLGIILFWVYDASDRQKKTRKLVEVSVGFIVSAIRIARLPLVGTVIKPMIALFEEIYPEKS
jgi:AcrR family transcriptional regulator